MVTALNQSGCGLRRLHALLRSRSDSTSSGSLENQLGDPLGMEWRRRPLRHQAEPWTSGAKGCNTSTRHVGNRSSLKSAAMASRRSTPWPTGATIPNSARWPRIALITAVCWLMNRRRVRWSIMQLCCTGVLVGTNHMLARVTFADRLSVGGIVLLALDVRLHIGRRHQPYRMPQGRQAGATNDATRRRPRGCPKHSLQLLQDRLQTFPGGGRL
jgi:hypothetical protein